MASFSFNSAKFDLDRVSDCTVSSKARKSPNGTTIIDVLIDGKSPVIELNKVFFPMPASDYQHNGKVNLLTSISYTDVHLINFFKGLQHFLETTVKANSRAWCLKKPVTSKIYRENDEYESIALNLRVPSTKEGIFRGTLIDEQGAVKTEISALQIPRLNDASVLIEIGPIWISNNRVGIMLNARALKQLPRELGSSSGDAPDSVHIDFSSPVKRPRSED